MMLAVIGGCGQDVVNAARRKSPITPQDTPFVDRLYAHGPSLDAGCQIEDHSDDPFLGGVDDQHLLFLGSTPFGVLGAIAEWRARPVPETLLRLDLDDDGPFLDKFVVEKPPRGKEKKSYPRKNSHLALFAAWEFASQGKRTLIFSTQANWVESYGKQVVDLCKRGYLESLLDDEASISRAMEVDKEWLGEDHPAVACL